MTDAAGQEEDVFVVERSRRLSESFLWDRQRRFYQAQAVAAWSRTAIPNHITTNPYIARAYARVIAAWLRDLAASSDGPDSVLDPAEPVYILELGSGPGRFGFYFLRQLSRLLDGPDLRGLRVVYVMTDVVEANLDFCVQHPALQPYAESGMLDFALFDAENPGPLELRRSGTILGPGTARNPVAAIANYVFDSIRQDIFSVENGEFRETRISLTSRRPEDNLNDPELLRRLTIRFEHQPAPTEQYIDDAINAILEAYRRELPDIGFLFPVAALECAKYLSELSPRGGLLLAADKGYDRMDGLLAQGGPGLALHDAAFSLAVNFEALGRYVTARGGQILRAWHRNTPLVTVGLLTGLAEEKASRVRRAFADSIAEFGPDHLFEIVRAALAGLQEGSIDAYLALIRLSDWDPGLLRFTEPLLSQLESAGVSQKRDVYDAMQRLWENYYFIGEEPDGAAQIGTLLRHLGYYSDALTFLQRSLHLAGARPQTYQEMGICFLQLQQWDLARQCAERALELDPNFGDARSLYLQVRADEERRAKGMEQRSEDAPTGAMPEATPSEGPVNEPAL